MFGISYDIFIRNGKTSKNILEEVRNRRGKRDSFKDSLQDLFDIAHKDAMTIIKIEEDRQFLKAQREKGRRGSMAGIDVKLAKQEERALARSAALAEREERYRASTAVATEVSLLEKSSEEEASSDSSEKEPEPSTSAWPPKRRRGTISVVTRDVAAALDRTKTSSRKASHILSALVHAITIYMQHQLVS